MSIRNVLLHASAENTDTEKGAAAWALGLAGSFQAKLTALVYQLDVVMPRSAYGRQIVADSRTELENRNREAIACAERLRSAARQKELDADIITDRSFAYGVPEIVADRARLHDIVVSGVEHTGILNERSIAEHLIFEAGRPVVVVPGDYEAPFRCESIVVAWDWGRTAARALGDAMPLLRRAEEVRILSFRDEKQFDTSLGEEDLLKALEKRGVSARFENAERGGKPIGEAMSTAALDLGADLLVMGGYGHSRLRQFVLGGATRATLDGPGLPTLLSH
jgi:nucleotide-binding universal stress UspA family protein